MPQPATPGSRSSISSLVEQLLASRLSPTGFESPPRLTPVVARLQGIGRHLLELGVLLNKNFVEIAVLPQQDSL